MKQVNNVASGLMRGGERMKMMRLLCAMLALGLADTAAADPLHQIVMSWQPAGADWSL